MKYIETKDDMRKRSIKSPDCADALMMAMHVLDQADAISGEEVQERRIYAPVKVNYLSSNRRRQLAHAH